MKILLTNDDGIYSKGISALYKELTKIAEVMVVAPITEQSAVGHAITISDPIKITEVYKKDNFFGYGVHGTPSDCVKLAFDHLLPSKPDWVISGINHGANLASNVIYSGTVSAATEGAMLGVKSIAVSLTSKSSTNFEVAAEFIPYFIEEIKKYDIKENALFNINVPPISKNEISGWKFTQQGTSKYLDTFEKRIDPRGNVYYWLTGEDQEINFFNESDDYAINQNFISVTPLQYNLTDYNIYNKLSKSGENKWTD
jgi:5'-nucleotidase